MILASSIHFIWPVFYESLLSCFSDTETETSVTETDTDTDFLPGM